jgi:competence protein ComEA
MTNHLFRRVSDIFLFAAIAAGLIGSVACGGGEKPASQLAERPYEGGDDAHARHSGSGSADEAEKTEAPAPTGPIKINEVTVEELVAYKVSGLGQATAEGIIEYRDAHGPFRSVEDVDKAPRVGEALLAKLQDKGLDFGDVPPPPAADATEATAPSTAPASGGTASKPPTASAAPAPGGKINVNTATAEQLEALNGVGPSTAQKIVEYRAANGPFKSVDELDNVPGIGPATIAKFRDQATL